MALSKKILKNDRRLAVNATLMIDQLAGKRALVLSGPMSGLEDLPIKDYYDIVILESDLALVSVPVPDVTFYSDETPYRNNQLYFNRYAGNQQTIFVVNYHTTEILNLINRQLGMYAINYLPTPAAVSDRPTLARQVGCGLNALSPGVHLAQIMGCGQIFYDRSLEGTELTSLSGIQAFLSARDTLKPKNLIAINRETLIARAGQ